MWVERDSQGFWLLEIGVRKNCAQTLARAFVPDQPLQKTVSCINSTQCVVVSERVIYAFIF